jgi:hypothetical protein
MSTVISLFQFVMFIMSDSKFILFAETMSFITATTIGFFLCKNYINHHDEKQHNHTFYFLLLMIIGIMFENFSWILKISCQLEIININHFYTQITIMFAWVFNLIGYQSLGLFIENLTENKFHFQWHQKIFISLNSFFIPAFIYSALCHIYAWPTKISIHTFLKFAPFYFIIIILPSLIIATYKIRYKKLPAILKKQLNIFITYIIIPRLIFNFIECFPFYGPEGASASTAGIIATISLLFMNYAIIFCSFNLTRFRLFNFSNKVQDDQPNALTGSFKDSIEHISVATTAMELLYITQTFFKENFGISPENVCLNFRYKPEHCSAGTDSYCSITNNIIESFINKDNLALELLQKYKILVADEINFDTYYTIDANQMALAQFLEDISSEIFLPMYDKNNIIAYLTIQRTYPHKFYSASEQNKIVIFGTYLASTINIMHNSNTSSLLQENKKLKEELYLKHQESNQYKESIKNLIKQKSSSQIGIMFYKDHRFTIGNETAQKMVPINLNHQKKHPTTIAITKLVEQVESFRTMQSRFLYDHTNKQILITAVPHFDHLGGVIVTLHYPDSSDIIKGHIDQIQDPSQIDYLLYLETTKNGKLINQAIPSNSESLLNFKIKLLEIALNKKATLLESHSDDLMTIVEIIHHISLRSVLHVIDLKPTTSTHDLAIKLFGINPLLLQDQEDGLLKKLDKTGTLFIKNIELVDLETQNKLAEYIRYGVFTITKSEHRIASDVRIICSVQTDAQQLITANRLSVKLYNELATTMITMPSLLTMDEKELSELIEGFTHQTAQAHNFSALLQISKKDKDQLIDRRPASLVEFKSKIQYILNQKSTDYQISHETHHDPRLHISDPILLKAANLGKYSLKDPQIMTLLWNHFHCQNKIAQFLGVNRSSVNRRCKEYNLQ